MPIKMLNGSLSLQQNRSVVKHRLFCLPVSRFPNDVRQRLACETTQSERNYVRPNKRESKPKRPLVRDDVTTTVRCLRSHAHRPLQLITFLNTLHWTIIAACTNQNQVVKAAIVIF